jgi:hypothetical protein
LFPSPHPPKQSSARFSLPIHPNRAHLVSLSTSTQTELDAFYDGQKIPADYEPQLMKLASLRQRVTNINSQLAATQVTFFFVFESKALLASVLAFGEMLLGFLSPPLSHH